MKILTTEERYKIYIDKYVGVGEEDKNDGSGETITGKRSVKSFLCRMDANNFTIQETGESYADKWLDEEGIPKILEDEK